jgi:hypothetical protein
MFTGMNPLNSKPSQVQWFSHVVPIFTIMADKVNALPLEPVQIKGKAQPVTNYVLKGLK